MKSLYETIKRGEKDFPLSVYNVHRERDMSPLFSLHWHYDIEIIMPIEGSYTLYINDKEYLMQPGKIYFINPGEKHRLIPESLPISYTAVVFSPELISFGENHFFQKNYTSLLEKGTLRFPRYICSSDKGYKEAAECFKKTALTVKDNKGTILINILSLFFCLEKNGHFKRDKINGYREETVAAIEYLKQNYPKKVKLSDISKNVHLTPNYLCNVFKADTGMSVFSMLLEVRLSHAVSLLEDTDLRIPDIALKCGFENIGFFIKKFKERFNITPARYRKEA